MWVLALLPAAVSIGAACGGAKKGPNDPSGDGDAWAGVSHDTKIEHEACDPKGKDARSAIAVDPLTGAKHTVTQVLENGKLKCSFADLNGDGRTDYYRYYGDDGLIRRHEASFDVTEQIDEIGLYKGGVIDMVMRETNFDRKLDTWDYYDGGKLARRERDKTGDGRVDEWWTFEPAGSDNATVVEADPKTGKPDPTQVLKLGGGALGPNTSGKTGAKPAASTSASASASTAPSATATAPSAAPSASASTKGSK